MTARRNMFVGLTILCQLFGTVAAGADALYTFAGVKSTTGTFSGNGGSVTAAYFKNLGCSWSSTNGEMYFADRGNYRIRKMDSSGIVSTTFGTGSSSVSGNGGSASSATGSPFMLFGDSMGKLYFTDNSNAVARVIDASGNVAAFAGGGSLGSTSTSSADNGQAATSSSFSYMSAIVVDTAGDVYILDTSHNKIKKVTVTTSILSYVAGTGSQASPDTSANNGNGGQATSAKITLPTGMFLDTANNLYFNAYSAGNVRVVSLTTGIVSLVAGGTGSAGTTGDGGPATAAKLASGYTFIAGNVDGSFYYISGTNNNVRKISAAGIITLFAGSSAGTSGYSGDGGDPTSALLYNPVHAIVYSNSLFISEYGNNIVRTSSLPTSAPVSAPTMVPTTIAPTTVAPTFIPTAVPSIAPTVKPTVLPTVPPTTEPTALPTYTVTVAPSVLPTILPTVVPTVLPTVTPTAEPTLTSLPTVLPTVEPSVLPTVLPTVVPTLLPTVSNAPSDAPTVIPTVMPTLIPTVAPTIIPTVEPSVKPTVVPTVMPTVMPTVLPTVSPTVIPTLTPTVVPTAVPTTPAPNAGSVAPSVGPTVAPTLSPSLSPNAATSVAPTESPTVTAAVSTVPSAAPTHSPSVSPSVSPTVGYVDISFDTNIYLHNCSVTVLDETEQTAVTNAVAETLNIEDGQVTYVTQQYIGVEARRRRRLTTGGRHQIMMTVHVWASSRDYSNATENMGADYFYETLFGKLTAAVESDALSATVRETSAELNAVGTMYVGNVNLTVTSYTVEEHVYAFDDADAKNGSSESGLSGGAIAGIVIGCVAAVALIVACLVMYKKREKKYKTVVVTSSSKENGNVGKPVVAAPTSGELAV